MRGGMKSGQGIPLCAYPGPPPSKLSGVRARPEKTHPPPAGRYGGKGENEAFSLVAPPCDPVSASPSVPKAELLLEHEDAGRTGRRVVLFVVGPTCIFPFSPLLSMTFPLRPPGGGQGIHSPAPPRLRDLAPSGRGKGACYGGVAPLRGPFPPPRITPLTSR